MKVASSGTRWFAPCWFPIGLVVCCSAGLLRADVVLVETRAGGQNTNYYREVSGNWQNSSAKSTAPGTTTGIGSRFCTADGGTFRVSPTLQNAGSEYIVEVTHGTSSNIPTNLLVSVTVTGGSGLPTSTDAFNRTPEHVWRTVGTITLVEGVTTPTIEFTKLAGATGADRFYADAIRFTYAGDPCLQTPQIATVNGPLAAGQTYVDVPTVAEDATAVVVYADGMEIGGPSEVIGPGLRRVTTNPLVKGQVITATQVGANGIESCRLTSGALAGGGANPRVRISLSIRQNTALVGPIGTNGGTTGTPVCYLGATNTFNAGWGLAPVGGRVIQPDACWQTVTFQRGPDSANPIDPTYAWSGYTTSHELQGDFGVLDSIAFAIDDLTDTGPFRIQIDEFRNGDVLVQGFESATNGQTEVMFLRPARSGIITTPFLLAQPPGAISPDISQVTNDSADAGTNSLLVSWQFIDRAGGNWLRLLAQGSGTPNPQLDLRLPISFRMRLLPAGMANPPLRICGQPQSTAGLQTQPVTLEVRAVGTQPLSYQWYCDGAPLTDQTNQVLTIPSAELSDSGTYYVVVTDATGSLASDEATVLVEPAAFSNVMEPLWKLEPDERPYLAVDGQQSGLAYNPATGNLILVTRSGGDSVRFLDGETGADEGSFILDPIDVNGGYYVVNKAATTPDGSVYVCNLTTNVALDTFKIYQWLDETPDSLPWIIHLGDPSHGAGGRWGDTLDARLVDVGGILYPEFVVAGYDDNKIAVLRSSWTTDVLFTLGDVPPGAFNHGLAWGAGDTVWGKSYQGDLYHIGLDFENGTAALLGVYANMPSLAPIKVEPANQLLGAVSVATPDTLRLYSLANLAGGLVGLDTEPFAADNPWAPAAGAVAFGPDRVYALNPNHGIVAMRLNLEVRPVLQMARTGNLLTLTWTGSATLQSAPGATGPYTDLTGITSPHTVDVTTIAQQFYRLRN